jgi:hypothetical protein
LPRDGTQQDDAHAGTDERADKPALAAERDGFNLHAGVRIEAGDDLGRERLARYGARPPLSLERLRRLPGGRVAYRLKYVDRGRRGKQRVMTAVEFMARLSALIAPPRYPLTRFAGVLAPRSKWRPEIVPKPREKPGKPEGCDAERGDEPETPTPPKPGGPKNSHASFTASGERGEGRREHPSPVPDSIRGTTEKPEAVHPRGLATISITPPPARDVVLLAPNIISVRHWDRLLGGLLYATSARVDWASLLRRSLAVDVLECPKCRGRLQVVAVITEREPVRRILAHLGMPTVPPTVARARDPTDDAGDEDAPRQLALGVA